ALVLVAPPTSLTTTSRQAHFSRSLSARTDSRVLLGHRATRHTTAYTRLATATWWGCADRFSLNGTNCLARTEAALHAATGLTGTTTSVRPGIDDLTPTSRAANRIPGRVTRRRLARHQPRTTTGRR